MGREHKQALMVEFARVGKAVSNPSRLALLELLAQVERSVEELADEARLPVGNTSAQLQVLKNAGLVRSRRDGNRVYYRLAGDDVAGLYASLIQIARKRLAAVEAILADHLADERPEEPVTREELLRRVAAGEVVVLDVRPAEEYAEGHVPGAVSIQLDEIELRERLDMLPRDQQIVAYCRGDCCLLAVEAVRLLRLHDRDARPMEAGMIEWRLAGLPVEAGPAA